MHPSCLNWAHSLLLARAAQAGDVINILACSRLAAQERIHHNTRDTIPLSFLWRFEKGGQECVVQYRIADMLIVLSAMFTMSCLLLSES